MAETAASVSRTISCPVDSSPPAGRKTCLQVCIFDRFACQKCFCVTLDKSNRTEDEQVYEIGGVYNAKNDKRNGG